MNTVRRVKNGQYDVHLDLYMMLFMKNLLKKWVECTKSSPFSNIKQSALLEQMEAALNLPKDVDKLFQEKITSEQISVLEKENEELKAKISVLLSCKNCPENNKGGYICVKEYNDQCLAQKIQYINELKEEIEELKDQIKDLENDSNNCEHLI